MPRTERARAAKKGIDRRTLLIGGGAGAGLILAWALWPRSWAPAMRAGPGETLLNAFLKIGEDGRVTVAVGQAEMGQGVWTAFAQIVADELGADWRTMAVEPAPAGPLYANRLLATQTAEGGLPDFLQGAARWTAAELASRRGLVITGGSTSVRAFEPGLRLAAAGARLLLLQAAARRWGIGWEALDSREGFVVDPEARRRLAFAELAADAGGESLPEYPPMRGGTENRLAGQPLPRLDLPSKIDGSALFAGDIRLPDMLFASARTGPAGSSRLAAADRKAALAVPGVTGAWRKGDQVAVVANNWWAADRGLKAMNPRYETLESDLPAEGTIEALLEDALASDDAREVASVGDLEAAFAGGPSVRGHYYSGPAATAALETLVATARTIGDRLEIWAPVQAPGLARAAAAKASGMDAARVTLYPTLIGGGHGRKLESDAVALAASLARDVKRPVQLMFSRAEDSAQERFRPPARAAIAARLSSAGSIAGWHARIAAPDAAAEVAGRLGAAAAGHLASPLAGAVPPYAIPAMRVVHVPAPIPLTTGVWRSGGHAANIFFIESFVDELSRLVGIEPLSFRMQMLGDNPRLARCLAAATALGGWDGGAKGSRMGIAAASAFGSHAALLVEVEIGAGQRIRVRRAHVAVDCGRVVNPVLVRQQIEGGINFGIAAATARPVRFEEGRPAALRLGEMGFPLLRDTPEIIVELIGGDDPPGGASGLGVPLAAPAIANALHALTGQRLRDLPLVIGRGS